MTMAEMLNQKFAGEVDIGVSRNSEYIKADKDIHKFIREEFSEEKTELLDKILRILISIVADAYVEEGIKLGARSTSELIFDKYFV